MQGMRELMRSSLGRSLRDLSKEDRLAAAWPVACGSALAGRSEIESLDAAGILHIGVRHAEWMQPLLAVRTALQNDVSRIAGVPVSGIHFQVKARTQE